MHISDGKNRNTAVCEIKKTRRKFIFLHVQKSFNQSEIKKKVFSIVYYFLRV